jgi:putative ABC transport system substrate-binding protein
VKRREFIALGAAAAAVYPVTARAQQPRRPLVGVLMSATASDRESQQRVAEFKKLLQNLGWTEGHNVRIELRWFGGELGRAKAQAKALIDLAPDVIVVRSTTGLDAVRVQTRTIPIVFWVVTDPVGGGYVESMARPGGNVTGFSSFEPEMGTKWLEALTQVAPQTKRVAVVTHADFPGFVALSRAIEAASSAFGVDVQQAAIHSARDIEPAIAVFASAPNGSLIVLPSPLTSLHKDLIIALAMRHRLPAVYPFRFFAAAGGLMSYGVDQPDLFRRAAVYVDRILRGARPGDLPVQAPTKFELAINLKTAKSLGLDVPPTLLATANEIID